MAELNDVSGNIQDIGMFSAPNVPNVPDENVERIIRAAKDLIAQGVEPTNEAVRRSIGKISFSHVSPVMQKFREHRKILEEKRRDVPPHIKRLLDDSFSSIWVACDDAAKGRYLESLKKHDEAMLELRNDYEEVVAGLNESEQEKTELAAQLQLITNDNEGLQLQRAKDEIALSQRETMVTELQNKNADSATYIQTLELKLRDANQQVLEGQNRLETNQSVIAGLKKDIEGYRTDKVGKDKKIVDSLIQIKALNVSYEDLKAQKEGVDTELTAIKKVREDQALALKSALAEIESLKQSLAEAKEASKQADDDPVQAKLLDMLKDLEAAKAVGKNNKKG